MEQKDSEDWKSDSNLTDIISEDDDLCSLGSSDVQGNNFKIKYPRPSIILRILSNAKIFLTWVKKTKFKVLNPKERWNLTYFYPGVGLDDLEYDELGINWTQEFASYPSMEDSMYDSTYSSATSTSSGMSWNDFGVTRFKIETYN